MNNIESKFCYVSIIGAPNVGKSTLVNSLVGQKVSIVTRKEQTTRNRIIGIFSEGDSQIVMVDTPGIFKAKRKLHRAMVLSAWSSLKDADLIVLVVEANKDIKKNDMVIKHLNTMKGFNKNKLICVINKIDLIQKPSLLNLTKNIQTYIDCKQYFFLSALKRDGIKDFKIYLSNNIPKGQWLYPENQISDITSRLMASEIVREKLMNILHQELPYELIVETEDWNDLKDGSLRIDILIYVNKKGQKKILIGSEGSNIKKVGIMARKELEIILEKNVHLFLYVKVQKDWDNNPNFYRTLGLKYNV